MERREDWEERLNAYIAKVFDRPHDEAAFDCCVFTDGAIEAQTGETLMSDFAGKYETQAEGEALIRKAGYSDLAALLEDKLARVPRPSVQRGDLVMVTGGNLAIAWGDVALAVGLDDLREGVIRIPRDQWRKAWRVG